MALCMWQAITPLLSQWLPISLKTYLRYQAKINLLVFSPHSGFIKFMNVLLPDCTKPITTYYSVQVVQESMSTYGPWNLRKHFWMKLDVSKQLLVEQNMKNFDLRMFHICGWYTEMNPTDLHQYIVKCNFQILMVQVKASKRQWVNLLWPSDATWWHKSESTWAQVMPCCLVAPSHYLNQCWLIIIEVQ